MGIDEMKSAISKAWGTLDIGTQKDILRRHGVDAGFAGQDPNRMRTATIQRVYNALVLEGIVEKGKPIFEPVLIRTPETVLSPEEEAHPLSEYIPRKVEPYRPRRIGNLTDVDILERAVRSRLNILLIGETGTGKTHALEYIAYKLRIPYFRANFNGAITPDDLIGQWVPAGDGRGFNWLPGILIKFIEGGGLFVADEINFAKPDMLAFLNPLLDFNRYLVVYPHEGERITATESFVFAATMNPASYTYQGARQLNLALQDRFNVQLNFVMDKDLLEGLVPDKSLLDFKEKVDEMVRTGEIRGVLSMRGLLQYMQNCTIFGKEVAKQVLLQKFSGVGYDAIEHMMELTLK